MYENNPNPAAEQIVISRDCRNVLSYVLFILGGLNVIAALLAFAEGDEELGPVFIIGGIILLVIGFILFSRKTSLVVTTKRVYIAAPGNNYLSLPLNRISSVGTGGFRTINIGSSAGRILLSFVPDHLVVYNTIVSLLNQVQ